MRLGQRSVLEDDGRSRALFDYGEAHPAEVPADAAFGCQLVELFGSRRQLLKEDEPEFQRRPDVKPLRPQVPRHRLADFLIVEELLVIAQVPHEPARKDRAQHTRPVSRHASPQRGDGLAVDVHGVVRVLPPQLMHLPVRQLGAPDAVKDVRFDQLGPGRVDDAEEVLTHPFHAVSWWMRPDIDEIRILRGDDCE